MTDSAATTHRAMPRAPGNGLLGLFIALVLVAGCIAALVDPTAEGGAADEASISLVAAAPDRARAAGTARLTVTSTSEAGGQRFAFTVHGINDFTTGAGVFSTEFELAGERLAYEFRTDGEQLWISVPEASRSVTDGRPWMVLSALSLIGGEPQLDPDAQLAYLDALIAAEDTEVLGSEVVQGVPATHYRAVIHLESLLNDEIAGPGEPALQQLQAAGLERIPTEVWITDDGLPVRQVFSFEVEGATNETVMELSDFGVPLDLVLPGPEESYPVSDPLMMGQILFAAGG